MMMLIIITIIFQSAVSKREQLEQKTTLRSIIHSAPIPAGCGTKYENFSFVIYAYLRNQVKLVWVNGGWWMVD